MAKAESQGGGRVEEIKGTICSNLYSIIFLIFNTLFNVGEYAVLGEASQAQGHPRGRGEEIGPEKEGRGGTSPT